MSTESRTEEGLPEGAGVVSDGIRDHSAQIAQEERGMRRRLRWFGLVGVVAALAGIAAIGYVQSRPPAPTALEAAYERCEYEDEVGAQLADEGRTLLLQTAGEENSLGMDYLEVVCAFDALDVPTRVTTQIVATRALDGRVSDSWDGFTAAWNYHPNSGLNLMITID